MLIDIPESFARATVDREGERGRAWLASLPGTVDGLLTRWGCEAAPSLVMHGQVGVVVPVVRRGHGEAVLKVSFPHPGNVHEPHAFAAWAGRGAVRLYERDDERFAMLLERAGPHTLTTLADTDLDAAVTVAGRLVRGLAVPAPPGVPRLSDRAGEWEESLRKDDETLGRPLPARALDAALATVRELAHAQPDTLVHGDLHYGNVLSAEREPWLAIDAKGVAGDPAYDGSGLLRTRFEELFAAPDPRAAVLRLLAVFADAAGVDRERAHRWAHLRAVQALHWDRLHGAPAWLVRVNDRFAELLQS